MSNSCETPLKPVKRILLKVTGESFCPMNERGISMESVNHLAEQIAAVAKTGVQVAVVMGGGNILRGAQLKATNGADTLKATTSHYMGMLATVINGSALHDALVSLKQSARLMTAVKMDEVAEPYIYRRAIRHMEKGRVVILAGGMGTPYVTTDTAAAQRAIELEADYLFKATKVDGVYSADPNKDPDAVLYDDLTFDQALEQNLRVMDQEAFTKCREHNMPIRVFNFRKEGLLERAARGEQIGTLVHN